MHYAHCVECPCHWLSDSFDELEDKATQHESDHDQHFVKVEYPIVTTGEDRRRPARTEE